MGTSGQRSVSAAGTIDTALSGARTAEVQDAESDSSGAEKRRRGHGRRSPEAARSQVSTAAAAASQSTGNPAGSAVQPSGSADGESALSAAEPDAGAGADASFDGSVLGHVERKQADKENSAYCSASAGDEQGSIAGAAVPLAPEPGIPSGSADPRQRARGEVTDAFTEHIRPKRVNASAAPSSGNCGSKQTNDKRSAVASGNSKGSPKRTIQRPAQAQVEGASILSGGGGQPTPAISVLCNRHLSANGRQIAGTNEGTHFGAVVAVPAHASSHHTPQATVGRQIHGPEAVTLMNDAHNSGAVLINASNSAPSEAIPRRMMSGTFIDGQPQHAGSAVHSKHRDGRGNHSDAMAAGISREDQVDFDSARQANIDLVRQAGSGVSGHPKGYQQKQASHSGRGYQRGGRQGTLAQPRSKAYSSSAIVDPAAQPQMARIEGFLDPIPRPQVASIHLQLHSPIGVPEVTQPSLVEQAAQPQMALIEGWPGPLIPLERALPIGGDVAVSAMQEEDREDDVEHANPATSVHATVVMDGTISEGETDLSSLRHGVEGNIGSLDIGEDFGQQSAHSLAADECMEASMPRVGAGADRTDAPPGMDSRCVSITVKDDPMDLSNRPSRGRHEMQAQQSSQAMLHQLRSAQAHKKVEPSGIAAPVGEMGSSHRGGLLPVHPATSVHATVMADGTLSDGDTDLSSQQQGRRSGRRSISMRPATGDDADAVIRSNDSRPVYALDSMPAPHVNLATGSTSRGVNIEIIHENASPDKSQGSKRAAQEAPDNNGLAPQDESVTGQVLREAALVPVSVSASRAQSPVRPSSPLVGIQIQDTEHVAPNTAGALSSRCDIMPVHPTTSVHATVVMDGEQSEGDTDLSSMRQEVVSMGSGDVMDVGMEGHPDLSQKMVMSSPHSNTSPAVAIFTGDVAPPQISSRSMSAGSHGRAGAQIVGAAVGGARSPAAGPSNAEIHDSDRPGPCTDIPDTPQATKSTAHGRMQDDMPMLSDAEGPQLPVVRNGLARRPELPSPAGSDIQKATPGNPEAAVSGTSSPMDPSLGHAIPCFRAASATLAGSPEAPNPRIKQANTGVHHGAMAISLHNEAPAVPGVEAEGGSGTWQQAVQRAHGTLIEDDTDHSSPLEAAADAGSLGSMGSGEAAEACEHGSRAGSRAGSLSRRIPAPATTTAAVMELRRTEHPAASVTGLDLNLDGHLVGWGLDHAVEHGSGSATMRNANAQAIETAHAMSDIHGMCDGPEDVITDNSASRRRSKRTGTKPENGEDDIPNEREHDLQNARPANSGTEPSDALVNGSTIGSLGSHGAAGAAAPGVDAATGEEADMLGPSAAQMAAAATAAAAAMSATAGTVIADGLPPLPRTALGRTGSHAGAHYQPTTTRALGSPSMPPLTTRTPQRPVSSQYNQGTQSGGRASSSYRAENINGYSTIEDGHLNGVTGTVHSSRDGMYRNGYAYGQNAIPNTNQSRRNGYHGHPNHVSTTTQMPVHQPALTVMAPIGAVAGFDSQRAYSNRSRSTPNGRVSSPPLDARRRWERMRNAESQAAVHGSGPAHSRSSADIRRNDGKRKRCSSVEYPEKPNESSITSSIS